MKKISIIFTLLAVVLLAGLGSCGHGGENSAKEAADSFSVAYFNYRFADAEPFATQGSRRWLSFAASQMTQEAVDTLRAMKYGAEVDVSDVDYQDDTTAVATVGVSNFMSIDSIGRHPRIVAEKQFVLPLVLRNDTWLVNLSALP